MNCRQIEEGTADYLAGDQAPDARSEFEAHLADCLTCREAIKAARELWAQLGALPEASPGLALQSRFDTLLEAYRVGVSRIADEPPVKLSLLNWWTRLWQLNPITQLATVGLVFLAGVFLGPHLKPSRVADPDVAQLRDEVGDLRHLVSLTLLQQPSASERLAGVSWSQRVQPADDRVLAALIQALETDPNVNVRVAAVEAIGRYANRETVKQGLLRSLAREAAPLVQIELIDLMVQGDEKAAIPLLRQIMENPEANLAVRLKAEWGLQQLS